MSRSLALGLVVMICAVAVGFGAYFATRPQATVVSAPEPGVSVSSELAQAAAGQQPTTSTDNVVASPPAPVPAPTGTATAAKPSNPASTAVTGLPPSRTTRPPVDPAPVPPSSNAGWTGRDRSWPSGSASTQALPPPLPPPAADPVPLPPPGPPPRMFEDLVVSADSVLGLQLDSTVSSEVARIEDPVEARVTRDVRVGPAVAIPAGTRVLGSVMQVERGGKMKDRARLGIRFHTLVMADNSRLTIYTDAIYREGSSPGQESAAKVGAAALGGAILGAIIGGGKGAAIGGTVGAAGGTAAVMAGGRNPAVLRSGTPVTVRLKQPVTVTIEREQ